MLKLVLLSLSLFHPGTEGVEKLDEFGPKFLKLEEDHPENTAHFWETNAFKTVKELLARKENKNIAKNVILFLGDGMSVPTLTATRVYLGNENVRLSFEKFPYTAMSKTYCVNSQVADSACSATAYLGGVKGNIRTIGVTAKVNHDDCEGMADPGNHVRSIFYWAQVANKSTGLVTTAKVTDASPAGVYGHVATRWWQTDNDITKSSKDPKICDDLTIQLVHGEEGKNLKVIMGGGRGTFLPNVTTDEEGGRGLRTDNVNLIEAWKKLKEGKSAKYIWNREQLLGLNLDTDYLLGLFENDHCHYNLERDKTMDPSLTEMTTTAIKLLSKKSEGYFLFVEGARIDMAHHAARAHLALDETAEFSNAIQAAVDMTSEVDTLIVVTSDHGHTMSVSGYPPRGNDIFGIGGNADDNIDYTTLSYANGPGYRPSSDSRRHDPSKDDLTNIHYQYGAIAPLQFETHGGDDVVIFARGPWSHLFAGVMEQNVIPYIISYASCVGKNKDNACVALPRMKSKESVAVRIEPSVLFLSILCLLKICIF